MPRQRAMACGPRRALLRLTAVAALVGGGVGIGVGAGPASAAPVVQDTFQGLNPARLLDTRAGLVPDDGVDGKVGPGSITNVTVLGRGGVPGSGVGSVALNVTVAEPETTSYITVFPKGSPQPTASNLNMTANQTVANSVIVPVGADGQVSLFNESGNTHLLVDVMGWFPEGPSITGVNPARLLDTRGGLVPDDGVDGKVGPGSITNVTVLGRGGVPGGGVGSVALNVTVAEPDTTSYVTVFPKGAPQPTASNLNMTEGKTVANSVIVPVGADGQVSLFNESGNTHLLVDVTAWFPAGPSITGVNPSRLLDTRAGLVPDDGIDGKAGPASITNVTVLGRGGVPGSGVGAVAVNVTVAEPDTTSYVTVFPKDAPQPTASNLNMTAGLTVANSVVVPVGADGQISLFNESGNTHLLVDVTAWFPTAVVDSGLETQRANVQSSSGAQSGAPADSPAISADGRYVVFTTTDTSIAPGTSGTDESVFRRDLTTGETVKVSIPATGPANPPNGSSFEPAISADGRYVVFHSFASNLVAGDTNGLSDVFRRDMNSNSIVRVSVGPAGIEAVGGNSSFASISADGNLVTFVSQATNLVVLDTNGHNDVFLRDVGAGTTTRVSVNSAEAQGTGAVDPTGGSFDASISGDGRFVAFTSDDTNLDTSVSGGLPTNGARQVYIRELGNGGNTTMLSVTPAGGEGGMNGQGGGAFDPSVSFDGRFVTFHSSETDLVAGDPTGPGIEDVYRRDRQAPAASATVLVAANASDNQAEAANTMISADGRYIVYSSASADVADDTNGLRDVFVKDLATGVTTRVSVPSGGGQATGGDSVDPAMSSSGGRVVFVSSANNLVAGDSNGVADIFVATIS